MALGFPRKIWRVYSTMASRPESPATALACTARRLRLRNSVDVCAPRATAPAEVRCSYSSCRSHLLQLLVLLERGLSPRLVAYPATLPIRNDRKRSPSTSTAT